MAQKRLRIFAGPNGSGKSSMLREVTAAVYLGYFINADEIEKLIRQKRKIDLTTFGINANEKTLYRFFSKSGFVKSKSDASTLKQLFSIVENKLSVNSDKNFHPEYAAAIIADFLREENLKAGNDFSFETVMSHKDKIAFLKKANRKGYHCYLYFICTDDVRVNIERIKTRVKQKGHHVPEDKVRTRYLRTLGLLYDALKVCYKSYLFDNSNNMFEVARIDRDKTLYYSVDVSRFPNWFIKYVLKK